MRISVVLIIIACLPGAATAQSGEKKNILTRMSEIGDAMKSGEDSIVATKTIELRGEVDNLLRKKWPFAPRYRKLADLGDALTYAEEYAVLATRMKSKEGCPTFESIAIIGDVSLLAADTTLGNTLGKGPVRRGTSPLDKSLHFANELQYTYYHRAIQFHFADLNNSLAEYASLHKALQTLETNNHSRLNTIRKQICLVIEQEWKRSINECATKYFGSWQRVRLNFR
jgi:hypothetical protein